MQDEENKLDQATVHSSTQILNYALKCEVDGVNFIFFTLVVNTSMVSLHRTDLTVQCHNVPVYRYHQNVKLMKMYIAAGSHL